MGDRTRPRGATGVWKIVGTHDCPPGSDLRVTFFAQDGSADKCADVEEAVGDSKRRLVRILGEHSHERAISWMEGYLVGKNSPPPLVRFARSNKKRNT